MSDTSPISKHLEWTEYTASMAISCAVCSTIRGERSELVRRFGDSNRADKTIENTYGFVMGEFDSMPTVFPATRGVIDLVAYAVQTMRIPHPLYTHFLATSVEPSKASGDPATPPA
jgi:hypothetical protein